MSAEYDVQDREIRPIKVAITLVNFEVIWGFVYLHDNQRLQDLMNDEREFLPIEESKLGKHYDEHFSTVIRKSSIIKIREIDEIPPPAREVVRNR